MKLRFNIFKQLVDEPFEKQIINDTIVEIHHMKDDSTLNQFANRGNFVIWTSDGKDYKLLIEPTYYEAMKAYYKKEVNAVWIEYFNVATTIKQKSLKFFFFPIVGIYILTIVLGLIIFPEFFNSNMIQIALGFLIIFFIGNMISSSLTNKKFTAERAIVQEKIDRIFTVEQYDELIKAREEHYRNYFQIEDTVVEESLDNEEKVKTNEITEEANEKKEE